MFNTLLITGGTLYISSVVYKGLNQGKIGQWRKKLSQFFGQRPVQTDENTAVKVDTTRTKEQLPASEVEHGLALSSLSLALATASSLFHPALAIASLPVLIYLGVPAGKQAVKSLRQEGKPSTALLDTVILAVCLGQGYYIASSLLFSSHYLSQKYLLKSARTDRARLSDVAEIPSLSPGQASSLQAGQMIVIEAGEIVPADGIISDGIALIDQYQLTGNHSALTKKACTEGSRGIEGGIGDKVFAGTIVLVGQISMQVERVGDTTQAAQLSQIRQRAAQDKTDLQVRSQRLAQQLALPLLCLGSAASFVVRPLGAIGIMAARLGYDRVAPLGKTTFLAEAARHGILIRDGRALEALSQVEIVVIDHQVMQRPESLSVIRALRERHVKSIVLFTSHLPPNPSFVRTSVGGEKGGAAIEGIERCFTEELPEDKAKIIEQLQAEGEMACYIGHLIEEPIQKAAHVTISLSQLSNMELKPPQNSALAQITLLDGTLNQLGALFEMAKSFEKQSQTAFMMTLAPAIIAISGPFLFHSGLLTTIVLNQIGLLAGLEHAMRQKNLVLTDSVAVGQMARR